MTGSSPLLRAIAENRTPRSATPNPRTRVGRILRGFGYRHFSRRGFSGRADDAAQATLPKQQSANFQQDGSESFPGEGAPSSALVEYQQAQIRATSGDYLGKSPRSFGAGDGRNSGTASAR